MLIVSWNVAGLKPALQRIHEDYGGSSVSSSLLSSENNDNGSTSSSTTSKKASLKPSSSSCAFTNYLQLHGNIDILCLQEHKIPLSQLSSRSEPHRCSTISNYESFWCCATDKKSKGFNGVVTYAKVGTVQSANCSPLNDPDLDNQGRCIMTDHGSFVLFNVYVPNGIHANKMKFLSALRAAMNKQRTDFGKKVMLIGDMNLKIHKRDIYWKHRVVNVDELLLQQQQLEQQQQQESGQEVMLPKWKVDVYTHWNKITSILETLEAIPCTTTNPNTKQTFDRWRARVKLGDNDNNGGRYVILGTYEESADDALFHYTFGELYYEDPNNNNNDDGDTNTNTTRTLCRKKNVLSVEILTELMSKLVNVTWDIKTQREIANSNEADLNPDSPAYKWVKSLLEDDKMVDVFRHMYPEAEGRFTCWHQQKNKRYTNEGGRIDFTLVDQALMDHVDTNSSNLRCGSTANSSPHNDPNSDEAALMACTSNGLYQAPSFAGGGIAQLSKRALDSQFGIPHTGMIYTPPSYSDHIAISLLMKKEFNDDVVGHLTLQSNPPTRKSQPHKKQKSIASFLCAPGGATAAKKKPAAAAVASSTSLSSFTSTTALAGQKRPAQQLEDDSKPFSLKSYFGDKKKAASSSSSGTSKTSSSTKTKEDNGSSNSKNDKKPKKNSLFNHFSKK